MSLPIVQYLIEKGASIEVKDEFLQQTPLHWAYQNGHFEIVQYLIEKDSYNEAKDGYGKTPLHYHIEKGANIEATSSTGRTALHFASAFGKTNIVKFLVSKGANKNAQDINGQTPFDVVCEFAIDK